MWRTKSGFSLIELLVVIAIIAILAALLFPIIISVKQQSWITSCSSNVRELSRAVLMYVDDQNGEMAPAYIEMEDQGPGTAWTWRYCIMPYVKNNKIWVCPAFAKSGSTWWPTDDRWKDKILSSYGLNFDMAGADSNLRDKSWCHTHKVSEYSRPTKTLMVLECQNGIYWPYYGLLTNTNGYLRTYFPTFHRGKVIVSFLDGHTAHMFLKNTLSTDPQKFMWKDIKPDDTDTINEIKMLIQRWPLSYPPNGSY